MEQEFYVLKDESGYHPMAFISPKDMAGEIRKEEYETKKLEHGEEVVSVRFIEITN